MLTNSRFFLDDAKALGQTGSAGQFFLFTHAIELSLKSFLHLHGTPFDDLKSYSHGLFDAWTAARSKGLSSPDEPTTSVLKQLDAANHRAALRYEFSFEISSIEKTRSIAEQILKAACEGQLRSA